MSGMHPGRVSLSPDKKGTVLYGIGLKMADPNGKAVVGK